MIETMDLAILVGSVLVIVSIFTSLISFRLGAPLLLVLLLLGLVAGEDGILGIVFDDGRAAYFIGSIALAIILFDSGFATRLNAVRSAILPAVVLATLGTLITATIAAIFVHLFLPFDWPQSFLLGAIVSSTDAAAVFFLLHVGGVTLRERVRGTLELESGTNDPIAIFLTIAIIEFILAGGMEQNPALVFFTEFALEIGLGTIFGLAGGWAMVKMINRTELEAGLYPILLLASALALFGLTTMLHGSGFLAVYIAGLYSGNAKMRGTVALRRFNNGMTWLAQIAMFLTLGLLATPSEFLSVALPASALGFMLILVARPIAVWLCLAPFDFSRQEIAFIAWVGLRGAVSILLAILPVIEGVEGGRTMFNVAFIVVVISLLIQGWSINPMARRLRLIVPQRAGPVDRMELELPGRGDHEIVAYRVHPESAVAKGERIPRWARPSLIVRDGRSLRPHTAGRPKPGDQIYIVTATDFVSLLDRLFAAPVADADPALYGEFALDPDVRLGDVGDVYGFAVAEADRAVTLRDFMRRELAGDIEQADRVSLGEVALIVRLVDEEHRIEEIGLAVLPARVEAPNIPVFQSPGEIAAAAKGLFGRLRGRRSIPASAIGPSVPVDSGPHSDPGVGEEHDLATVASEATVVEDREEPSGPTVAPQAPEKAAT